jgi:predicted nucleotidyltransferase
MGTAAEVQAALAPLSKRIAFAMIYGSVARGTDRADSDIDVLVVSDRITLEELYRRLAGAERKLRRKVSPTLYTSEEFRRKGNARNPFLAKVLSGHRVVLIGSEDDASGA